jgi:hypothetical protein
VGVIQNHTRKWSADYAGYRNSGQEQGNGMTQLTLATPVRQIEKDSGKVPGLSHPQQKPHNIQVEGCLHEASQHCHDSPTDQYPRNPDTRSDLVQQQVAGYLKNEVAEKEYSREEPELLASDSQFPVHRQSRKANVDAVEESNHHKNEDERDDPSPHFEDCSRLNYDRSNRRTGSHAHLIVRLARCKMPLPIMQLMTRAVIVERLIARMNGTPQPIDWHSVALGLVMFIVAG